MMDSEYVHFVNNVPHYGDAPILRFPRAARRSVSPVLRFPDSPFLRLPLFPCPSVPQNEQVNVGNNVPH
jgi:hypothetical protein